MAAKKKQLQAVNKPEPNCYCNQKPFDELIDISFRIKKFSLRFLLISVTLEMWFGTVFFVLYFLRFYCDFEKTKISEPEKCDTIELDGFTRNKTKTKTNSMEESKPKWKIVSYRTTNENTHKMIFGVEESEWNFVFVRLHQVYWNFKNGSLQFN